MSGQSFLFAEEMLCGVNDTITQNSIISYISEVVKLQRISFI